MISIYLAHETAANAGLWHAVNDALQRPAVAIPLVSLLAIAAMLGKLWWLKRFTSWKFPTINERKK